MQGVQRVPIKILPVELADGRIGVREALQSDGGVQGGARVAVGPVGARAAPGAVHALASLPRDRLAPWRCGAAPCVLGRGRCCALGGAAPVSSGFLGGGVRPLSCVVVALFADAPRSASLKSQELEPRTLAHQV